MRIKFPNFVRERKHIASKEFILVLNTGAHLKYSSWNSYQKIQGFKGKSDGKQVCVGLGGLGDDCCRALQLVAGEIAMQVSWVPN